MEEAKGECDPIGRPAVSNTLDRRELPETETPTTQHICSRGLPGLASVALDAPKPWQYCVSSHFLVFVYITFQHISHGDGRHEVTPRTGRSGARCRSSVASCADEQPHIGNYRLLKTIGKGNFAKVKLARHILTGREVNSCACFCCGIFSANLLRTRIHFNNWEGSSAFLLLKYTK